MRISCVRALFVCGLMLIASLSIQAQRGFERARSLVGRVQEDLHRAERRNRPEDRERERFHNARHHLSDFDRGLSQGRFDKDRLDTAIDDVKNVVEGNRLAPESRDELRRDLEELRRLRQDWDEHHR
jgi:hypothetical protein